LGVAGESNNIRIHNVYSSFVDGRYVFVDSDNKIGTLVSSRRFKKDIEPMDQASEGILKLKPVNRHYKDRDDKNDKTPQFALIAEDVEKVNRDLVAYGKDGKVLSVR
jgi:hypothetical protein